MKKHINIDKKNEYLEIKNIYPHPDGSYDISFEPLLKRGLEEWIKHLSEKTWWNQELKTEFIKAFNKIKSYGTKKNV